MSDQYLGEIRPTAFNFAPVGWALCQGQILPISRYTALFSLLGTYFGGNGTTTFSLPDLRGRVGIGLGTGTGLSPYTIGESAGEENVSLTLNQIPLHSHLASANANPGGNTSPQGSVWTQVNDGAGTSYNDYAPPPPNVTMPPTTLSPTGGSQPMNILQPYLTLNYIIALEGIFPPRP
ncbi:phage tail protein [Edaphobacter sp. 12200R-103]|jgi:microcystin-dependent protein|nr:phage tail protein [Edaphobacter sp. 12200R-103]